MKHTKGKWTIYDDSSPIVMANINGENYDIAIIPDEYLGQETIQANTKLIAAAPELLEALQAFQEMFIHQEGETKKNQIKTDMIKYCDEVKEALNNARTIIQKATN